MRDQICRRRGKIITQFNAEISQLQAPLVAETGPAIANPAGQNTLSLATSNLFHQAPVLTRVDLAPPPNFAPVPVYIGRAPGYIGPVAQARPAHSPVGTEPVPETASAYAAPLPTLGSAKTAPLKPYPSALPIKGSHAPHAVAAKAASEDAGAAPEEGHSKAKAQKSAGVKKASGKIAHAPKAEPAKSKLAKKSVQAKEHALAEAKPKAGKGEAAGSE
jgi:D-alanyl-D-alanine carboxypeptidase